MDDLQFRLENMDRRGDRLEFLLTTLLGSLHTPGPATSALATTVVAPASSNRAMTPSDTEVQVNHWPDSYFYAWA
jgi:hypothetical protein